MLSRGSDKQGLLSWSDLDSNPPSGSFQPNELGTVLNLSKPLFFHM